MIFTSGKRAGISGKLKGLRGNVPLFGVSALIFIFIIAAYFTSERFISAYTDKDTVTEWTYTYSDDPDAFTSGNLRTCSPENPIVTDKSVMRDYILFEKRLPPSEEDRTLVIITDHSPVRVFSGGNEIYNNRYGDAEYTGNSYNAVTLHGTGKEQVVEIYLRLPFSVVFETYFINTSHPAYTIEPGATAGAALCVISLLAIFIPLIMSIVKKRFLYSVSVVFLLAITGAAIFLIYLPESTYLLNNPLWMNISYAAPLTLLFAEQFCMLRFCRNKTVSKAIVTALFASSVGLAAAAPDLFFFRIFSIAAMALCVLSCIYTFCVSVISVQNRAQLTSFVVTASMLNLLSTILCAVLIVFRIYGMYTFVLSLSSVAVSAILFFASYYDNKAVKLNTEQMKNAEFNGEYLTKVCECVKELFNLKNKNDFYGYISEKAGAVISAYFNGKPVSYGVAKADNNGYREIINNGLDNCRYDLIADNGKFNNTGCIVSKTYVAFIIKNESRIDSVIYYEGIDDGLNEFFEKMMRYLLCGIQASYNKYFENCKNCFKILKQYASEANEDEKHLNTVHDLSYELCIEMRMTEDQSDLISDASYLHDIGKNAVSRDLLFKDGRLNEYEYATVMEHAKYGGKMIDAFDESVLIKTASDIAHYHHEKYNGSGYYGLKGEEIPLAARMIAVCDVYDALVSDKPYKKRWTTKEALKYISDNAGTLFDADVADAFVRCMSRPYIKKETL